MVNSRKCHTAISEGFFFLIEYHFAFIFPCLFQSPSHSCSFSCFLILFLTCYIPPAVWLFPLQRYGPLQCSNSHFPFSQQPGKFSDGVVCRHLCEIGVEILWDLLNNSFIYGFCRRLYTPTIIQRIFFFHIYNPICIPVVKTPLEEGILFV